MNSITGLKNPISCFQNQINLLNHRQSTLSRSRHYFNHPPTSSTVTVPISSLFFFLYPIISWCSLPGLSTALIFATVVYPNACKGSIHSSGTPIARYSSLLLPLSCSCFFSGFICGKHPTMLRNRA